MKVKIGDKIYDANKEPIMIILSDADKLNIGNMHGEATKYIIFPDEMDSEEVLKWADKT